MLTPLSHKLTSLCLILCAVVLLGTAAQAQVGPVVPTNFPNDLAPGSVLFFGRYTSSAVSPSLEDTQISITNTHPTQSISVHMYMVDGGSCSIADSYIELTGSQTSYFLASDFDPGVRGYIVAVATSGGYPTQHNYLLGVVNLKESDGRQAEIPAVAVVKKTAGPAIDGGDGTAIMRFDGIQYCQLPAVVAVSAFNSQTTDNTVVTMFSPSSDLMVGESSPSVSVFGIMYNDLEVSRSLTLKLTCHSQFSLKSLRVLNGIDNFIPRGRTGWVKFYASGRPLLGISTNKGQQFTGGRNLSVLTLYPTWDIKVPAF
ncbi:MAG: hypothetical protein ACKV2V_30085 [Blastocatellia bacterium]